MTSQSRRLTAAELRNRALENDIDRNKSTTGQAQPGVQPNRTRAIHNPTITGPREAFNGETGRNQQASAKILYRPIGLTSSILGGLMQKPRAQGCIRHP